jgi:hypothetical protein
MEPSNMEAMPENNACLGIHTITWEIKVDITGSDLAPNLSGQLSQLLI